MSRPATVKYPTYDHRVRMIRGEGIGLRVPVPADRERWLEMLHDSEQTRFGSPVFVKLPETIDELDARIAEAACQLRGGRADDPDHRRG